MPFPVAMPPPKKEEPPEEEEEAVIDTLELAQQFQEGAKIESDDEDDHTTPLVKVEAKKAPNGILSPLVPEDSLKHFEKNGDIFRLSMRAKSYRASIQDDIF